MNRDDAVIEPAVPDDAAAVYEVQRATWIATYPNPEHDIRLHVAAYNDRAIAFYRRHGFTPTGREWSDGALIPEVEMIRRAD